MFRTLLPRKRQVSPRESRSLQKVPSLQSGNHPTGRISDVARELRSLSQERTYGDQNECNEIAAGSAGPGKPAEPASTQSLDRTAPAAALYAQDEKPGRQANHLRYRSGPSRYPAPGKNRIFGPGI